MISRLFCCVNQKLNPEYHLYVWTVHNQLLIQQNFRTKAAADKAFAMFNQLYDQHPTLGRLALRQGANLLRYESRLEAKNPLNLPKIDDQIRKCLQDRGNDPGSEMYSITEPTKIKGEVSEPSRSDTAHSLVFKTKSSNSPNKLRSALKKPFFSEEETIFEESKINVEQNHKIQNDSLSPSEQTQFTGLSEEGFTSEAIDTDEDAPSGYLSSINLFLDEKSEILSNTSEVRELTISPAKLRYDPTSSDRNYRFHKQ